MALRSGRKKKDVSHIFWFKNESIFSTRQTYAKEKRITSSLAVPLSPQGTVSVLEEGWPTSKKYLQEINKTPIKNRMCSLSDKGIFVAKVVSKI